MSISRDKDQLTIHEHQIQVFTDLSPTIQKRLSLSNSYCWSCHRKPLNIGGSFHFVYLSSSRTRHVDLPSSMMDNAWCSSWAFSPMTNPPYHPTKLLAPPKGHPYWDCSARSGKNNNPRDLEAPILPYTWTLLGTNYFCLTVIGLRCRVLFVDPSVCSTVKLISVTSFLF